MTLLICTGTLYSGGAKLCEAVLKPSSHASQVPGKLSEISSKIIEAHLNQMHAYEQRPFSPAQAFSEQAAAMRTTVGAEETAVWWDVRSSLYLDFWRSTFEDSKFLLFYTSPDQELANFFASDEFDVQAISNVVSAWAVRARAMLEFFTEHRTICLLVNSESASHPGAGLIELINKQFGVQLKGQFASQSATNGPNIADLFLANSRILGNEDVAEIYDELRSLTTVLEAEDKKMTDDRARAELLFKQCVMENQDLKKALKSGQKKSERLELARAHIKELQSELEFYYTQLEGQIERNELLGSYVSDDPFLQLVRKARVASAAETEPGVSEPLVEAE